jgi:hypothetical protein
MRLLRVGCWVISLMTLALFQTPRSAQAHVRSTIGFSEITQEDGSVYFELSLEYELMAGAVGLGEEALAATAEGDRIAALEGSKDRIGDYLVPNIALSLDGVACEGTLTRIDVEEIQGLPYATFMLTYECLGSASGPYELSYGVFADSIVDEHINVVDYRLGDAEGRSILDDAHRHLVVGASGMLASALSFVALGVEHILSGIDHVLFLLALLLGARGLRSILKIATTFTVAHSITLALASLGWVQVAPEIVEPLIALSIAYVAVGNIIDGGSKERLLVVFGFGLIHGLGFASTLSFTEEMSWRLFASIFTFNVGIELGQALVIALVFPILLLVRRFGRLATVAYAGATSAIAALGFLWFFERLFA